MPDFDIDFQDTRLGDVIDYVTEKYGDDKVARMWNLASELSAFEEFYMQVFDVYFSS